MKRRANAAYHWIESNPATAILVCSGLSALVAITLTAALGLYSTSTFEGKTACGRDANSKACADLRLEVAEAEPLRNPCTSYQRVTGERGRNCERRFVQPQGADRVEAEPAEGGSDGAREPGETDTNPDPVPVDPGSEQAPAPPKGDGTGPTTPAATNPPPSTGGDVPSSSPGAAPVSTPPPAATAPPPAPAPEPDPPGVIQSTVDRVDEAITPTVCAVSELLRGLCP
jgi:hypothetical protein